MARIATLVALVALALAALPASASAATYFVAQGGTDTGDCTVDPCETVQ